MTLLTTQTLTMTVGQHVIGQGLNLSLNAGDIWAILGQNGSGKTTFLHTLAGLNQNYTGTIDLHGQNLLTLTPRYRAQHIGILLQDTVPVFDQTVAEYCAAGRYPHLNWLKKMTPHDKNIIAHALKTMSLTNLSEQSVLKLSGGERRRLALATLLAQKTEIVLLDEPTNHLDIRHQILTLTYFSEWVKTEKAAVMMALHDLHLAKQFCNRFLLFFPDGRTLCGLAEEVLQPEILHQVYDYPVKLFHS